MTETNGEDRALPDMPETPEGLRTLTCAQVAAGDYEARYLQNRLSHDERAAYEAHYFGCDACWASLRRATEVRAAFTAGAAARRPRWLPWALPAAAVLATLAVWQLSDREPAASGPVLRGAADSLALTVASSADSVRAVWPPHMAADVYRVRGFLADGSLVWSLDTRDTAIVIARRGAVRVDVAALDRARSVIGQSALVSSGDP